MTVSEEAVNAAEKRIRHMLLRVDSGGDALGIAVAALEAAAPFIAAQALEDAAKELAQLQYFRPDAPGRDEYVRLLAVRRGNADGWLLSRAAGLRGQG